MNLPCSVTAWLSALDMSHEMSCWVEYIPTSALSDCLLKRHGTVLGAVRFSGSYKPGHRTEIPEAVIPLVQVGNNDRVEIWSSRLPLSYGRSGNLSYAKNDELLFVTCTLDEVRNDPLDLLTNEAYDDLLRFLHVEGYPHLLRMWNFFHAINAGQDQMERYRHFCIGRQAAFARHGYVSPTNLPAASAIGTGRGGLWVYCLAARTAASTIENPRQVSAYHYPPCYGPRNPWFSRAVLKDWGSEWHFYISGTASIVGHESRNMGNPDAQLEETCRNLRTLLETAAVRYNLNLTGLRPASTWKVYVRSPQPAVMLIMERLKEVCGLRLPTLILDADLCRAELLIEVEGVFRFAK